MPTAFGDAHFTEMVNQIAHFGMRLSFSVTSVSVFVTFYYAISFCARILAQNPQKARNILAFVQLGELSPALRRDISLGAWPTTLAQLLTQRHAHSTTHVPPASRDSTSTSGLAGNYFYRGTVARLRHLPLRLTMLNIRPLPTHL
jgi:hypothetical protein